MMPTCSHPRARITSMPEPPASAAASSLSIERSFCALLIPTASRQISKQFIGGRRAAAPLGAQERTSVAPTHRQRAVGLEQDNPLLALRELTRARPPGPSLRK